MVSSTKIKTIISDSKGLKEQDTLRIIQALITSRITYGTPYLALKNAEINKLDIIIRKATKTALGLPFMASTDKLLKLGVHNTWEEMVEAHKASQLERLKLTPTGRAVLRFLNYSETYIADTDQKARLPSELRETICIARIPRNMHPTYHKERRQARSKALLRKYEKDPNTRYTDAARYPDHTAFAISVTDPRGRELTSATIPARNPETAEEAAIALAMTTCSDRALIFTDSQAACRNFQKGRVSATALNILKTRPQLPDTYVTWIPGHEGMAGNEAAHAAAREHASRAFLPPNIRAATGAADVPVTYRAILQHYRLERRRYPPPHPDLTKEESVIFRRLQTNTYTHGIIMNRIYPTQFSYLCPYCDIPDTLAHMILECPCDDRRPDPPVDSRASSTTLTAATQDIASAHTTASLDVDHGEGRDQYECDKAGRQEQSDDVAAAAQQDRAGNPNGCGRPTAAAATARVSLACGGRKVIYVGGEMAGAGATSSCRCTDTLLHRPCRYRSRERRLRPACATPSEHGAVPMVHPGIPSHGDAPRLTVHRVYSAGNVGVMAVAWMYALYRPGLVTVVRADLTANP
ncbi:uncharacterized protein LOC144177998 [Haemaphysalis longicornis]